MKKFIIVLSVFLAAHSVSYAQQKPKKATEKLVYICSKHPDEKNPTGEKCSVCSMGKVKITKLKHNSSVKGSQSTVSSVYVFICKMDGEVVDKSGRCPKCGMDMIKTEVKKRKD